jgi:hypothetical protein
MLEDVLVEGPLDLQGRDLPCGLHLRRVALRDGMTATGAHVGGSLVLEDVASSAAISCRGSDVREDVRCTRVVLRPQSPLPPETPAFDGSRMRVGRYVQLEQTAVQGTLDLTACAVGRAVLVERTAAARIILSNVRCDLGGVSITGGADGVGIACEGELDAVGATLGKFIWVGAAHVGRIDLTHLSASMLTLTAGTCVTGSVELGGRVAQGAALLRVHVGAWVTSEQLVVGGVLQLGADAPELDGGGSLVVGRDVLLERLECGGAVRVIGAQATGALRLAQCRAAALELRPAAVADAEGRAPAWGRLVGTQFEGGLEITGSAFAGDMRILGTRLGRAGHRPFACEIVGSTIEGELTFWDERLLEPGPAHGLWFAGLVSLPGGSGDWLVEAGAPDRGWPLGPIPDRFADLPPSFRITENARDRRLRNRAEAMADRDHVALRRADRLRQLSARELHTRLDGGLSLRQGRVGGDLVLTNLRSPGASWQCDGVHVEGDVRADWRARRIGVDDDAQAQRYVGRLAARADRVELSECQVDGSLALAGLRVEDESHIGSAERGMALGIVRTRIAGALRLVDVRTVAAEGARWRRVRADTPPWAAHLDGELVLDGSEAADVALAADALDADAARTALRAVGARIGRLHLLPDAEGRHLRGFLDLTGTQVGAWELGVPEGPDHGCALRALLERQRPFRRGVWQAVELRLHQDGLEEEAALVRQALLRRMHDHAVAAAPTPRLRRRAAAARWASRANARLTRNFTSVGLPLRWWLATWGLLAVLFSDVRRVDVATLQQPLFRQDPAPLCAVLGGWDGWDAVKFSLRFALPLVPTVGYDAFDAAAAPQAAERCPALAEAAAATAARPPAPLVTLLRPLHGLLDLASPAWLATLLQLAAWLLLSLVTGSVFARMSAAPKEHT